MYVVCFDFPALRGLAGERVHTRSPVQIEDDVLAHAADGGDAALFECCGDFARREISAALFLAEPHGFDDVSGDALGEAARNGFYFGEFRHFLGTEHIFNHERHEGPRRKS